MTNEYRAESTLVASVEGAMLTLATGLGMTPEGPVENPSFFSGFLVRPDVVAAGLLAVADVAGTRYADFGLAQRLANLDPVVTAGGDVLRFESFSACNGVHARLDVLREGLGSSDVGFGTTNVDINQPLRTALARTTRAEALHLVVGHDGLAASTPGATHAERKVNLPDRWVRGFAEVPGITAVMEHRGSLVGVAIHRLFGALPRIAPPGPSMWVLPTPAGWRTSAQPLPRAIPLPGASRLRGAERVLRYAHRLDVYVSPGGAAAWVLELPGARLTLVLSPGPFRGFSGEGGLLMWLSHPAAETMGEKLLSLLGWEPTVDADRLTRESGLESGEVTAGLAWLAASGRLGYDLSESAWFHRELPVEVGTVLRRNPRLAAAQRLVDQDRVRAKGPDGWTVLGSREAVYEVRARASDPTPATLTAHPPGLQCACAWEREHAGARGPCKHILAVVLCLRADHDRVDRHERHD
ncbi:SWIM zinc finger family protein [Nocardioides mangrovicus]|uniref:SWIM zinc finger family protein n=1 Tax=Nocardioides mangrovicus TaxID=2478913 RepID=A0A3L8P5Q0_9ACTN|nr:SWIM zinc finger family protein [Nocardioides mangrovicus]RLV50736.1 SWIM zinc finger family protein [Nocardioides mangrovicus]